jgi:putative protease
MRCSAVPSGRLNVVKHDLRDIATLCRQHGIKTYLTVNTIIYGEDIPLMHQIIDAAREAGITAVIASDVAVMTYCRGTVDAGQGRSEPRMEVHLSTQLNISNIEALRFYAQFADVVVLPRAGSAAGHPRLYCRNGQGTPQR